MIVVGGSASKALSGELARQLNCKLAEVEIKRFPDQECYVNIQESLAGQDAVIVQSSYPDQNIVELFLLQDAARNAGASNIITVIPYYGYARQDKSFNNGEAVSAKLMARHISMGCDSIITIDIHNPDILEDFTVPVRNISAMPIIGKWLCENSIDVIVSPDEGSKDRASLAAETAGCPWDFLQKTRIDGQIVEIKPKNLNVSGKAVAIVDDIIATGGTMVAAAKQLKGQGASKVIAACSHGLFTGGSIPRLEEAFDLVISTDTLERPTSKISAASAVAMILKDDAGSL
ncbi:MAG: ribose-phosphate diphosphokinase [Thermoplasmata archaeon]|nr:ribose-phosphate diphosphokinase [Thermoplasmata archaeon]